MILVSEFSNYVNFIVVIVTENGRLTRLKLGKYAFRAYFQTFNYEINIEQLNTKRIYLNR